MYFLLEATSIVPNVSGKISPFNEPTITNTFAGLPTNICIAVDATINAMVVILKWSPIGLINVLKKETDVKAAPTTEVNAAAAITIPKIL